jgi:hypothetical protein
VVCKNACASEYSSEESPVFFDSSCNSLVDFFKPENVNHPRRAIKTAPPRPPAVRSAIYERTYKPQKLESL